MPLRIPPQTRVILIPSDNQRTREYVINRSLLIVLVSLAAALAALLAVALITWSVLATRAAQVPSLQKRFAEASEQAAQVRALTRELEQMRAVQRQVYALLGVPEPPALAAAPLTAAGGAAGAETEGAPGTPAGAGPGSVAGARAAGSAVAPAGKPGPGLAGDSLGLIALPPPDLWPVKGRVTREFAPSGESGRASGAAHAGMDLVAAVDTPIKAAGKGVVTRADWDPFLGNYVEIAHGLGYVTVYGHCSRLAVREGDRVDRGQEIAFLGGTGQATAPHLHFEVWKNGAALDPRLVMTGDPAR